MKTCKRGLAALLLLAVLFTTACGTTPGMNQTATGHIEAATHNGTDAIPTPEAETPLTGYTDTALRQIHHTVPTATTSTGFFGTAEEVVPALARSEDDEDLYVPYSTRLYYYDLTTMQGHPIDLPGTDDGSIYAPSTYVQLFTTQDRLILIYDHKVESWALDLSDRITLTTTLQYYTSLFTDNTHMYYVDKGNYVGYSCRIYKMDLATGTSRPLLTLPEGGTVLGTYGGGFLMQQRDTETTGQPKGYTYHRIDAETGEITDLWQLDGGGLDIFESYYLEDRVFWQLAGDNTLYMHELATGETTPLTISDQPYHHYIYKGFDGMLPLMPRHIDMGGYDHFILDLSTNEIIPQPFLQERSSGFTHEVCAKIGEEYIIYLGSAYTDAWQFDTSGTLRPIEPDPDLFEWGFARYGEGRADSYFASYIYQWATISPEEYWAGIPNYTPFVLTAG